MRWFALVGTLLLAAAGGWWILQVALLEPTERGNASGFGQFALAVIGIFALLAGPVKKALTPRPPLPLDELANLLATAMRNQWEQAARDRRLIEPAPLPIRWRRSNLPVAVPVAAATSTRAGQARFGPLPGLTPATSARLREGNRHTLHAVYGSLASSRLIIAGPAGSGKSAAAILLLLDALRYREKHDPCIPVPVMFTLHGWDPATTPLRDWLLRKLTEIPVLRRQGGAELLDAGRIAVFLDGLDEIPAPLRPIALRALSDQASVRLVLLTRTVELAGAAQHAPLAGAAAIELQPISPTDAAAYLLSPLVAPPRPTWQAVADELTTNGHSPLALALNNPLSLTLLRDSYQPTGPVDKLLDSTRFPTPGSIENHLLDRALIAAYARRPGQPAPRYSFETAQRTLGYVANRLNTDGSRDLAWWTIPQWISPSQRILLIGLLVGLSVGAVAGIPALFSSGLKALATFGATLVLAVLAGLIVGSRRHEPMRFKNSWWRGPFRGGGPLIAVLCGLVGGLAGGFLSGVLGGGIALILIAGAMVGVSSSWEEDPRRVSTHDPVGSWRQDMAAGFASGVAVGCVALGGLLGISLRSGDVLTGILGGALLGVISGLGVSLLLTGAVWSAFCTQLLLAWRRKTPPRLLRFLEDARERHVLRTVGPVYQFRHAKLQDRLAALSKES